MSGSTFANPKFKVNIQDASGIKPIHIFLEGCFLNAANTAASNESYIRISLVNTFSSNSTVSLNGGFQNDGVLGRVGMLDRAGAAYNVYNQNPQFNDRQGNLLTFPNSTFRNSQLELKITFGDEETDPIVYQNDAIQDNYCIILGIWTDDC
ncbi:hypothetical protein CMI37_29780 [Candidatus Pacearchaeota archaeon]|nr:hypothetical protein [Candidatus Pacearchaeota archaeon]